MVALGNGAQAQIRQRIARLGTTVLQIDPQRLTSGGIQGTIAVKLTTNDVDTIIARSPNVVAVNWCQDRQLQVVWRNQNANTQVTGTAANFLEVRGFHLAAGRMFDRPRKSAGAASRCSVPTLPLLGDPSPEQMIGERDQHRGGGDLPSSESWRRKERRDSVMVMNRSSFRSRPAGFR